MKTTGFHTAIILIFGGSLLVAGCVVRERVAYQSPPVYAGPGVVGGEVEGAEPPPAPIIESVTVAPGPEFIWIGGNWAWGGGRWNWERGRWARPPHAGARW